jgi:uncharacterized protein YbjT (DUF2867 family)
MKIGVVGANGTLGKEIARHAQGRRHEVIAITRRLPDAQTRGSLLHRSADVASGEGLLSAVEGLEVVINAVNAQKGARALLVEGTRKLLDACARAGVAHYVAISIVGIDKVPLAYYGVKVEEEGVVTKASVGWSLLRATQFHDLVDTMFQQTSRFSVIVAPIGSKMQPIDVSEVAFALVDAAEAGPNRRLPDLGGPEVLTVRELGKQWLAATNKTRLIVPSPLPPNLARALAGGGLSAPDRALGRTTFRAWLSARYGARPIAN